MSNELHKHLIENRLRVLKLIEKDVIKALAIKPDEVKLINLHSILVKDISSLEEYTPIEIHDDTICAHLIARVYDAVDLLNVQGYRFGEAFQTIEDVEKIKERPEWIKFGELATRHISELYTPNYKASQEDLDRVEDLLEQIGVNYKEGKRIREPLALAKECLANQGEVVPSDSIGLDINKPCKDFILNVYELVLQHLQANRRVNGYNEDEKQGLITRVTSKIQDLKDKAPHTINYIEERDVRLIPQINTFKTQLETAGIKNDIAVKKLDLWLEGLNEKDWAKCEEEVEAVKKIEAEDAKCIQSAEQTLNLLTRLTFPDGNTNKAVQELKAKEPDMDLAEYLKELDDLLTIAISVLKGQEQTDIIKSQIQNLSAKQNELSQIAEECISNRKALNQYKETGQLNPVVPEPTVPDPDNPDIRNNICTKPSPDRWGVKFKYTVNGDGGSYGCPSSDGPVSSEFATRHEWFLTLLPAMRSVMPANGGMDTPGALPGLQFQIRSNVAKHKVPGFQPIFQHMGVDSIIITMIGTFTGDGGLGGIYSLKPPEPKEEEPQVVNAELVDDTPENLQKLEYVPWARQGKQHYLSSDAINPLWNKTIPTHNRALRPATGYTKESGVTRANWNPYNSPNAGWENGIDPNAVKTSDEIPWENPDIYMTKNLLRAGMFDRDGCAGTCPDPVLGDNSYDPLTGRLNMGQEQRLIGQDSDVSSAYTLRELSAYLDSYHEFTSFYKVAIHESREMEIEINLRKNHDGLNPQVNHFPKYARSALGMLRNDNGNPAFKGIVRDLRVFQARSDRTWYMMDIEVSDYGMAGKEPINLTNDLEERTKAALDELERIREAEGKQDTRNDSDECGEAIVEAADIKIRLRSSSIGSKGDFFVIDSKSGYSTYATSRAGGKLEYNGNNPAGGSITDVRSTLKHLVESVNPSILRGNGNTTGTFAIKNALIQLVTALNKQEGITPKVTYKESDYYDKKIENLNLERLTGFYLLAVNWRAYLDKDTGYGIKTVSGIRSAIMADNFELIPPSELFEKEVLGNVNFRWQEDARTVINNLSINYQGDNSNVKDCAGTSSQTNSTNTSNASGGTQAPPTSTFKDTPEVTPGKCQAMIAVVKEHTNELIRFVRGEDVDLSNLVTEPLLSEIKASNANKDKSYNIEFLSSRCNDNIVHASVKISSNNQTKCFYNSYRLINSLTPDRKTTGYKIDSIAYGEPSDCNQTSNEGGATRNATHTLPTCEELKTIVTQFITSREWYSIRNMPLNRDRIANELYSVMSPQAVSNYLNKLGNSRANNFEFGTTAVIEKISCSNITNTEAEVKTKVTYRYSLREGVPPERVMVLNSTYKLAPSVNDNPPVWRIIGRPSVAINGPSVPSFFPTF